MKFKTLAVVLLAAPALALAQGTASKPSAKESAKDPIAKVNGVAIPKARMDLILKQQMSRGAPDNEQVRSQLRENLINREIVAQEAKRLGLTKSADVQTELELAREQVLIDAYMTDYIRKHPISDADVQKQYDAMKAHTGNTEYKARHILVDTEDQAKDLIAQINKGAKFEDLAQKDSKDTGTKERGGDLGWNVPGVFDKTFSDAMVKLEKGKMTQTPVHTRFGYHVIRLDDVRPVQFPPLSEVKPRIEQQLAQQRVTEAMQGLRAKAKVE